MASSVRKANSVLSVRAFKGDAKTLLAFDLLDTSNLANLAGFTIAVRPKGVDPYYLFNSLQFKEPGKHAQVPTEPPYSSVNAPLHKFRWLHVPGSSHQGLTPFVGSYTYSVTPRFFDSKGALQPIDPGTTVSITVDVLPFRTRQLTLGFTRGFTQSQAFVHHFGLNALIRPAGDDLLFDTSQVAGTNAEGQTYTFEDEYRWSGYTARERVLTVLNEVLSDASLTLDVFAYDLNEPAVMGILVGLAEQGRVRVILDDAALHHNTTKPKPEDRFEALFRQKATGAAAILRGNFGRYAHDKVFVVSGPDGPVRVLTGSTNFSVTGMYVNSNHVVVFDDPVVAAKYSELFEAVWTEGVHLAAFVNSSLSAGAFAFATRKTPHTSVTFAPHSESEATTVLNGVAARIGLERSKAADVGSVLFAVMSVDEGTSPVYTALTELQSEQRIFSYGISDSDSGISLYKPGLKRGVLVTGKPVSTQMPPPFSQVPNIRFGHQVHHKFVVCGFTGDDPTVFCGSSNLALGGEQNNGDNLVEIHDQRVATVFALEAIGLVDHFNFLDGVQKASGSSASGSAKPAAVAASGQQAAQSAGWFLSTSGRWAQPYFDPNDMHSVDRQLFA